MGFKYEEGAPLPMHAGGQQERDRIATLAGREHGKRHHMTHCVAHATTKRQIEVLC